LRLWFAWPIIDVQSKKWCKAMGEQELSGLDGSNLLAFLAALGSLQCLSDKIPAVRISWRLDDSWVPVLHLNEAHTKESLLEQLSCSLGDHSVWKAQFSVGLNPAPNNLDFTVSDFRNQLSKAARSASARSRVQADFLVGLGTDAVTPEDKKLDATGATSFRTMSGQGHQHFLLFMRELAERTKESHLERALFRRWDYADKQKSMRWDPVDDRRYAYRANDPGNSNKDPILTMWGANRLAIEAISLFPVVTVDGQVRTVGFSRIDRILTISWPIWRAPLGLDVVRVLLNLKELQLKEPPIDRLRQMGIGEIFRSTRIQNGRFRNFTPATAIMGNAAPAS
jgi:hypothetical protein